MTQDSMMDTYEENLEIALMNSESTFKNEEQYRQRENGGE